MRSSSCKPASVESSNPVVEVVVANNSLICCRSNYRNSKVVMVVGCMTAS